jgi:putative oxidoreductase
VRIVERIGLGQWLRYLAATMQVAGGVLFLFRRTLSLGAAMVACTMAGAVVVDLWLMPPFFFIPLMLLFAIAATWMLDR